MVSEERLEDISSNLAQMSPPLSQTAGLHPTAEQIEMFAYHLPDATLSNLVVSIDSLILLPSLSHNVKKELDKCH